MEPKELAAAKRLFDAGRIVSFNEGREAGIKEVVEWIADICGSDTFMATDGKRYDYLTILLETYKAKLKEWGIG